MEFKYLFLYPKQIEVLTLTGVVGKYKECIKQVSEK